MIDLIGKEVRGNEESRALGSKGWNNEEVVVELVKVA